MPFNASAARLKIEYISGHYLAHHVASRVSLPKTRPTLPTKVGGTLHTIREVCDDMTGMGKKRSC
jgi:hypothetical protein